MNIYKTSNTCSCRISTFEMTEMCPYYDCFGQDHAELTLDYQSTGAVDLESGSMHCNTFNRLMELTADYRLIGVSMHGEHGAMVLGGKGAGCEGQGQNIFPCPRCT